MATSDSPTAGVPAYAELCAQSCFSFLRGASEPDALVARAAELGYTAIAIADEASVSGSVRAHLAARDWPGLRLLHGARFALADRPLEFVALVRNRQGWAQLCGLISQARRNAAKGQARLESAMLETCPLPDCSLIWLPSPEQPETDLHTQGQWLRSLAGDRLWLGASLHLRADDRAWLHQLQALSALLRIPGVACGQVLMARRSDKPLADLLTAIRLGRPLAECGQQLALNAERHLRSRLQLAQLFPEGWMAATQQVAQSCSFSLDELRYEYPDEIVPAGLSPTQWLRHLTEEGLRHRYPAAQFPEGIPPSVRRQVEHELALIAELRYEPYFLTVYDIVAFARGQGILCQGRGSAANSAVCYCLGITEVDPARMSMLFERFISRERNEPPDIDIDFEHQRREEVIQYLYQKYGRERAALAAALICYRPRSALRDAGKALGIAAPWIDAAAEGRSWWEGHEIRPDRLQAGLEEAEARLSALPQARPLPPLPSPSALALWARMAGELLGLPRHLSQHVGGFVIARHRLSDLVPVENAAMAERSVIQWDKDDIDALGLLKVDVLALGMLSALRRALAFIGETKRGLPGPMPMQDIPPEDPETYAMISKADTVGVFQIESRAQMSMLPRMRPACFYDLVIEVAIVRPGPIQGGMIHPYLRRRQGLEAVDYPGPEVREALARTLGVPIFQEQVMQLAVLAAGFTPGEADQLRRAMAAWKRKGGLGPFHRKVVDGMTSRGYSAEFAERVFAQIEGFGEYGFPESHAASFALLVYVSCWIKRHHPDAFLAALLNSQPMGFYAPAQLIRDAQSHGVVVLPVDVQTSEAQSHLEPLQAKDAPGGSGLWAVRLGLDRIGQLSAEAAQRIVAARAAGPFEGVEDLAHRAQLDRRDLQALAASGALSGLSGHRHQAQWEASGVHRLKGLLSRVPSTELPIEADALPRPTDADDVMNDYASLGLSLGQHPMAFVRSHLRQLCRSQTAAELQKCADRELVRASGIVTHRQRPGTARGLIFMSIEDETGSIQLVVPPETLERCKWAVLQGQMVTAYGQWQRPHRLGAEASAKTSTIWVGRLEDHTAVLHRVLGEVRTTSRDFH